MVRMAKTITLREANQAFSRCIREVQAGEEFVITRKGQPVARLTPIGGRRVLTAEQEEALAEALKIMGEGWEVGARRLNRDELYDNARTPVGAHRRGD
jgi:prevent-host-death family protein